MTTQLWERKIKGCLLSVVQGDLTLQQVDAIVNAANEQLHHGGGVAGAIVRAGGAIIQTESNAWVKTHGRVPTGSAAITGAGELSARHVIHAVGPIWGTGDEVNKLASAVRSALELAEQHKLASISLPAISSGIYGFPKELCAKTFFDTIENWLDERPKRSLAEIRLCNFDNPTANVFEREARRRFG
ncbi:MAG: macro domain-containing protein [Planctomycetes bacterium]|nr:macro domain-containing protein [Planctomycetota bacterium]MCB9936207.1 macro domain-containing protein [Planctomycetota bacterium]